MGYDFYITRAENWVVSENSPISADEWLSLVSTDPELRSNPENGPYFAKWSGPTESPHGSWFDWEQGRVFSKSPDKATLAKLLQIAEQLGASVQGDDGETYSSADELDGPAATPTTVARPWWKFW